MTVVRIGLVIFGLLISHFCLASAQPGSEQQFAHFSECPLSSGEIIKPCKIGYRTFGVLDADKSNVMLVPTWFTGSSADHAYLASPAYLDPETYFIVIIDTLANGVSSSPSNSDSQGHHLFPQITVADMVQSQHQLLREVFEIDSVHGVVGLSLGGMQAFEWAISYPGFATKTIAAIASPRLPSYDIALWSIRNNLLSLYRDCQCKEALDAMAGVNMLTYVPSQLSREVNRNEAVSTISTRGDTYAMTVGKSWDIQRQAEAMMSHNIARDHGDDMVRVASKTLTEFLIIVGQDDRVVTPQPARDFAKLVNAKVVELDADCGHLDPWCAPKDFAHAVRSFVAPEK